MGRHAEPDQRSSVAYALQMLRLYSAAFVRLGFGEWEDVSVRGTKLMRSILQADVTALLLLEDPTYTCAAVRGLPDAVVRRWAHGNAALDHLVATALRPGVVKFEGPLAIAASEIGLGAEVLAVPLLDIDASRGRVAVSVVSGPWTGPDLELTLSVLEIMSDLLAGAIANCQLRGRYQQLYLDLDEAREAAEEHLRTKNRFLARMSHELRTPLNIIIGYSELAQEELADVGYEREGAELVRPIHASGYHLLSIVNDMLDISKLQSKEVRVDIDRADLTAIIRQVVGEVSVLARAQRNEVILEGELTTASWTDAKKLRQILYNLLSNACKFTADGRIWVRVWEETDHRGTVSCFSVADSGIGIPPEHLDRIFDEFVQVDDSPTRRFGGTGLGLAVSRSFARLLGGDIRVHSVFGVGSTFDLRILTDLRGADTSPSSRQIVVVAPPGSERDLVCRFLDRCDYPALPCEPNDGVFDAIVLLQPLAVVIDGSAWSEGLAVMVERLEADPRTRGVRRVVLRGSDASCPAQPIADWVITKPITPERLVTAVGRSASGPAVAKVGR